MKLRNLFSDELMDVVYIEGGEPALEVRCSACARAGGQHPSIALAPDLASATEQMHDHENAHGIYMNEDGTYWYDPDDDEYRT